MTILDNGSSGPSTDRDDAQQLSAQEQQWVDKFMDETTLFLGPDPEIMRHHQIAARTEHENYCMTSDTGPIEADRIRKRLAGSLDEAFEMCESMGAAPGAKWADLSVAVYTAEATSATFPTAASLRSPRSCITRFATS